LRARGHFNVDPVPLEVNVYRLCHARCCRVHVAPSLQARLPGLWFWVGDVDAGVDVVMGVVQRRRSDAVVVVFNCFNCEKQHIFLR
jgi:hypothetical protein